MTGVDRKTERENRPWKKHSTYRVFGGGLPTVIDDAVVGGIGVSGASVEQAIACASAGLDAIAYGIAHRRHAD